MLTDIQTTMSDTTETTTDIDDEVAQMTEQIEASFGPISVYVSGTDTDDVQETFDTVWETMMDTSETMHSRADGDDGDAVPGRTFG